MIEVPIPSETAMRYYTSGNILWTIQVIWSLLLPALFFFTGFSAKLRTLSKKIGRYWFFSLAIYLILFLALYALFSLPLTYYASYYRLHEYGLSTMSLGRWIEYILKKNGVVMATAIALTWIPYLIIKKSPKRWWLYIWAISIPILIFFAIIQPMVISPIFHDFYPMKNKNLEKKILALADCAGIEGSRVYEVRMSADTKAMNAYMVGIGPSKQIVLWDTIIHGLSEDELLFVMGHEMGHYVLNHIWIQIGYITAINFFILWFFFFAGTRIARRFKISLADYASLPLFLFLFNFITLITNPIDNLFSRMAERQADMFGIELTKNNDAAGRAFVKLQQENLGNPNPGWYFMTWRGSHPSIASRIQFFNTYHPWEEGKPLKYEHYFNKECR